MVLEPVLCRTCQSINVGRHGRSAEGKPRYRCYNPDCQRCTFILNYSYQGRLPEVKQQILDMAVNGSGIRDTARVLQISPSTGITELKKSPRAKGGQRVPTVST
jgi:insertion element IS1 protein InsB